jgi:hypothetical protein
MEGSMSHDDVAAWLWHAMSALPEVIACPHPYGGTEYRLGELRLGRVRDPGLVELDVEGPLAEAVVRDGWATPDRGGPPGRLTVDLTRPLGGTVALWLLCRNYRRAGDPNSSAGHVSFDTPDAPPSIRKLDQVGISSLRSIPPGS